MLFVLLLACLVQCIGRLAIDPDLQNMLVAAGVIWRLVPLMFRYDPTMDTADISSSVENNEQLAANTQAKLACYGLGRLGGYFHDGSLPAALLCAVTPRTWLLLRCALRAVSRSWFVFAPVWPSQKMQHRRTPTSRRSAGRCLRRSLQNGWAATRPSSCL